MLYSATWATASTKSLNGDSEISVPLLSLIGNFNIEALIFANLSALIFLTHMVLVLLK